MKGKGTSQQPTVFYGYPAQMSLYGTPIKILYGQNRVAGDVIWTGNWQANPISGGKASKGGKNGGQQYDYKTAIIIGLCMGPVNNILSIYLDKTVLSVNRTSNFMQIPVSLSLTPAVTGGSYGGDIGVGQISEFTTTADDYGSPGPTTISGTQIIALEYVDGPPGPGQYTVNPTTGVYTFNYAQVNQTVQISYEFHQTSSSGSGDPIADFAFDFITGEQGQALWGYTASNFPSQALGYTGLAYVSNQELDLGSAGTVSNYSFEIAGLLQSAPGSPDCNPFSVILDFLTNSLYGVGFIPSELGDPTELSNYTLANSIFISPVIDSQRAARDWITEWLTVSNCEALWSDGVMKFRSYGDKTVVANGVTYTPNTQPIYDIDDDHYIAGSGEEPITVNRPSVRDANNDISVEWANRGNSYTHETLKEIDDFSIRLYGRRTASPLSYPCITRQDVAQTVAITQLRRSVYIRNQYSFKLGAAFSLLEPMDILTITDLNLGLNTTPVRIIEISEDSDSIFTITAEEFPWSAASPTLFAKQVRAPYGPGYYAVPGSVNTPGFVDLPADITQGSEYQVGIALCGGPNWGGCNVHVSTDGGNSYSLAGKFIGPSTMGVLTSSLPAETDPDNISTIQADFTESYGSLLSYTAEQKDSFVSLLAIDDEIISYQTAALTGTYKYNITKLRRGVYGSPITNHSSESTIMSLNNIYFNWQYDESVIGSTVFFKFTSFNQAGQNEEIISNVEPFQFFVQGPRVPYPWNVGIYGTEPASPSQSLFNYPRFQIQQNYTINTDGTQQALFTIGGSVPVNSFSTNSVESDIVLTTSSTGGSLPGGLTYIVGIVTITPNGVLPMVRQSIIVPSGTNTNTINVSVTFGSSGSAQIFLTNDQDFGWYNAASISNSGTVTLTQIGPLKDNQIVDENFDHLVLKATNIAHGGVWGGEVEGVISNGNNTCTVSFTSAHFSLNQYVGRVFSLIGSFDNENPMNVIDVPILSNDSTTLTIADVSQYLFPGDIVEIRTQATSATATSITDNLYVNGDYSGLIDNTGNFVYIIGGTGAFQPLRPISSNSTTSVNVSVPFNPIPDTTSSFIILNPSVTYTTDTIPISNNLGSQFFSFNLPIQNIQRAMYFVQAFSSDSNENLSLFESSPFREVWLLGSGGLIELTAGNYTQASSDGRVICDTSGGNIVYQLLVDSQVAGQPLFIQKVSNDNNTVTINANVADVFSNGATTIVLNKQGDSVELRF